MGGHNDPEVFLIENGKLEKMIFLIHQGKIQIPTVWTTILSNQEEIHLLKTILQHPDRKVNQKMVKTEGLIVTISLITESVHMKREVATNANINIVRMSRCVKMEFLVQEVNVCINILKLQAWKLVF